VRLLSALVGVLVLCGAACANPIVIYRLGQSFVDSLVVTGAYIPEEECVIDEFDVSDDCRLFFNGERITHVRLTSFPGDTLYFNGKAWLPARMASVFAKSYQSVAAGQLDGSSDEVYSEIPFVRDQLARGADLRSAVMAYEYEQWRLSRRLLNRYVSEIQCGASVAAARDAALQGVAEADTLNLTDPQSEPELIDGCLCFSLKGVPDFWSSQSIPLTARFGLLPTRSYEEWLARPVVLVSASWSPRARRDTASHLRSSVSATDSGRPCLFVIGEGLVSAMSADASTIARFDEDLARAQETGEIPKGTRHSECVRLVLEARARRLSN
jgi:hypothetical protein